MFAMVMWVPGNLGETDKVIAELGPKIRPLLEPTPETPTEDAREGLTTVRLVFTDCREAFGVILRAEKLHELQVFARACHENGIDYTPPVDLTDPRSREDFGELLTVSVDLGLLAGEAS